MWVGRGADIPRTRRRLPGRGGPGEGTETHHQCSSEGREVNNIQLAGLVILGVVAFVTLSDLVKWLSARYLRRTPAD